MENVNLIVILYCRELLLFNIQTHCEGKSDHQNDKRKNCRLEQQDCHLQKWVRCEKVTQEMQS
jgi:hypothetical protein